VLTTTLDSLELKFLIRQIDEYIQVTEFMIRKTAALDQGELGLARNLRTKLSPGKETEHRRKTIASKQRQVGAVRNDDQVDWSAAYRLFPGDVAYVWHAGVHAVEVAQGLVAADFQIRSQIVWVKQHFAVSRGHYHWAHEPCWFCVRKGRKANWCGDRTQSTVWEVATLNSFGGNRLEAATGHGTQMRVEVMRRPILNHTQRGDTVYDPFLGSGTDTDCR